MSLQDCEIRFKLNFHMTRAKCSIEADWYVLVKENPSPIVTITQLYCPKSHNFEIFISQSCHSADVIRSHCFVSFVVLRPSQRLL